MFVLLLLSSVIFCNGAGRLGDFIARELCCVSMKVKTGWGVLEWINLAKAINHCPSIVL